MEDKKLFSRICPKCGELCTTAEIVKANLGSGVQANLSCEAGHKWSEFFSLSYQGYWWDGNLYDSFGCMKSKEV